MERIDIVGNKKTKDFVIRREFRVVEGDAVNAFMIERGRKRVQALGFFKSVALKKQQGSAPDKVVIIIEVVEDQTHRFRFGVGYSTSEGVVGDISIAERNLFGNGQTVRLKLSGSMTRLQAEVGFTEPRFLGNNVAAGFDLFYKDVDYTTQASYKSQKIGGDVRLRYPISDEWSVGTNYTFSRNKIYDVGADASRGNQGGGAGLAQCNLQHLLHLLGRLLAHLRHARQQEAADLGRVLYARAGPGRARRRRALYPLGWQRPAPTMPSPTTSPRWAAPPAA